jgi:hypothetical protein
MRQEHSRVSTVRFVLALMILLHKLLRHSRGSSEMLMRVAIKVTFIYYLYLHINLQWSFPLTGHRRRTSSSAPAQRRHVGMFRPLLPERPNYCSSFFLHSSPSGQCPASSPAVPSPPHAFLAQSCPRCSFVGRFTYVVSSPTAPLFSSQHLHPKLSPSSASPLPAASAPASSPLVVVLLIPLPLIPSPATSIGGTSIRDASPLPHSARAPYVSTRLRLLPSSS